MTPILLVALGIALVMGSILWLRLHAFLALILAALLVASLTSPQQLERFALDKKMAAKEAREFAVSSVGVRVAKEFGSACGRIGILIALASIVGKCLLDSGAADRVVRSIARVLGEKRAPLAFLFSGYVLSLPVFFDTVFLLLVPLCKAMWMRTRKNYALYILAVIAGGSMNHSLVPPTPGPLFVATELKVDLGLMILMGVVVGSIAACAGMCYAVWIDRRLQLPVRESAHMPLAELEAMSNKDDGALPPLWLSLAPVLLPVLFIGGTTAINIIWKPEQFDRLPDALKTLFGVIKWLGDPNIALALSACVALLTLVWIKRPQKRQLNDALGKSLADGGQILLLIAGGGAFSGALQQTGIGQQIQAAVSGDKAFILPAAFLLTALVRGAQGSATVAMITAVGMFSSVATAEQLGFHPVYLALAIGCGSKPLVWMNDAGFWVIGKMSGMTESETLKTFSAQISIEGVVGFIVVLVLSKFLPMM